MLIMVINCDVFFTTLKKYFDENFDKYKIFLRLNNEGEEFNTINSCIVFGNRTVFIEVH